MTQPRPTGLLVGGRKLWDGITDRHELNAEQLVQLTEACRMKDRLDALDKILRGESKTWARLVDVVSKSTEDQRVMVLRIDSALSRANETANGMKQLIAALRLPDELTGKRPQRRGSRVEVPSVAGGAKARLRDVS